MKRSQSVLEYSILMVIIIAAFLTMQISIKRSFQGRWKQSVDELGDQYDTNAFSSNIRYATNTVSESRVQAVMGVLYNGTNGMLTYRTDTSNGAESSTTNSFAGY